MIHLLYILLFSCLFACEMEDNDKETLEFIRKAYKASGQDLLDKEKFQKVYIECEIKEYSELDNSITTINTQQYDKVPDSTYIKAIKKIGEKDQIEEIFVFSNGKGWSIINNNLLKLTELENSKHLNDLRIQQDIRNLINNKTKDDVKVKKVGEILVNDRPSIGFRFYFKDIEDDFILYFDKKTLTRTKKVITRYINYKPIDYSFEYSDFASINGVTMGKLQKVYKGNKLIREKKFNVIKFLDKLPDNIFELPKEFDNK